MDDMPSTQIVLTLKVSSEDVLLARKMFCSVMNRDGLFAHFHFLVEDVIRKLAEQYRREIGE